MCGYVSIYLIPGKECSDLILLSAIQDILSNSILTVQSVQAKRTTELAKMLTTWIPENLEPASAFQETIVNVLSSCINPSITAGRTHKTRVANRAKMWASYHSLRTSAEYQELWEQFLRHSIVGTRFCPMLCQSIGHYLFSHLVLSKIPTQRASKQHLTTELSYEELNGLRYAAGYVPRALMKKVSRSKEGNKAYIVQCLRDLISDGAEPEKASEDWISLVNRGGLICINNITFELFLEMEYEVRSYMSAENFQRDTAISSIKCSEDILFCGTL